MSDKEIRGRELTAPEETIVVNGEAYTLRLNNKAFRIAEDVYADEYGKDVGATEIMRQLGKTKLSAGLAVCYGAAVVCGCRLSFAEFEDGISPVAMGTVIGKALTLVGKSMPQEKASKNA